MNKIYTDQPGVNPKEQYSDPVVKDIGEKPTKKQEPKKEGLNKLLLGLIVVILIAVVTYFIIQQNKKDNG